MTPTSISSDGEVAASCERYASLIARAQTGNPLLSKRERQILDRLLLGDSTKEIASELDMKARTVESHIANMLLKTGTKSRMKLMAADRASTLSRCVPENATPFEEFLLTAKHIKMTPNETRQVLAVLLGQQ